MNDCSGDEDVHGGGIGVAVEGAGGIHGALVAAVCARDPCACV